MLQRISLNTVFERNDIQCPSSNWLVAYQSPPETLPALCAALWVKEFKSTSTRAWSSSRPRSSTCTGLSNICRESTSSTPLFRRGHVAQRHEPDRRRWFDAFSALLEATIKKGCTELQILCITDEFYRPSPVDETSTSLDALQTGPILAIERSNRRTSGKVWFKYRIMYISISPGKQAYRVLPIRRGRGRKNG